MKILSIIIAITIIACSRNKQVVENSPASSGAVGYTIPIRNPPIVKNDIQKIKWIQGKWKGMYNGKPFYEIYEPGTETLKITSYEWNGKDSSNTSVDYVAWHGDAYFLGKEQNYKVTVLSDSVIKMIPVKANNEIIWRRTPNGWDAILTGKKATNVYHMELFDPFKKLP
jgi:hypothetical protein